ncbi:MAG: phosphatidate cytidylyltransferase [Clostridia bacterium]|nr:phosphatidate cytidylyltransferase [Clostridia bacterium]
MKNGLLIRIITGLALVGLVILNLFLLEYSPLYFALLITLIAALCVYELNKAISGFPLCYNILSAVICICLLPAYILSGNSLSGIFALLCFAMLAAFILFTFRQNITVTSLQAFSFILIYPVLFLSLIYPMIYSENALFLLVAVFAIGPMADTFAFAVGSIVKGKKLCPQVSPKKTVSGAIGGIIGGVAAGIIIHLVFSNLLEFITLPHIAVMAVVGALGAFFTEAGDLAESALKRKLGIKDFGNLLPGHGGVLDRVDGIMFNAVFIYAFFSYIIVMI